MRADASVEAGTHWRSTRCPSPERERNWPIRDPPVKPHASQPMRFPLQTLSTRLQRASQPDLPPHIPRRSSSFTPTRLTFASPPEKPVRPSPHQTQPNQTEPSPGPRLQTRTPYSTHLAPYSPAPARANFIGREATGQDDTELYEARVDVAGALTRYFHGVFPPVLTRHSRRQLHASLHLQPKAAINRSRRRGSHPEQQHRYFPQTTTP